MTLLTDDELTEIRRKANIYGGHTDAERHRLQLLKHIEALTLRHDAAHRGVNELSAKLAREYIARGRSKLWSQAWKEAAHFWRKTTNQVCQDCSCRG